MKRKILFLCLTLLVVTTCRSLAARVVVPVYFHCNGAIPSTVSIFQNICQLNYNYGSNNVEISFYVGGINRDNHAFGTQMQFGINVYTSQSTDAYVPQSDAIKMTGAFDPSVLTHEVGHYLSLFHPDAASLGGAGCGATSCGGSDPDCCPDTQYPYTNNWMVQGFYGPGVFTPNQGTRAKSCAKSRGFDTTGALSISSIYIVPVETLTPAGQLTFEYDNSNCGMLPTSVRCIVRTQCPSGANEEYIAKNITNFSVPNSLNTGYGVQYVEYQYKYPFGAVHIKKVGYGWAAPPYVLCSVGGTSRLAPRPENHISIHTDKGLQYDNHGYQTAEVFDLSGRAVLKTRLEEGSGVIDISSLQSGMYLFKAVTAQGEPQIIKFYR